MATSDQTTTKIDADAWGTIHVSQGCGGVVIDSPLPADGERSARVILNAAQGDALIAAIGRALGRPAPTSTPLEERIATAIQATLRERDAPTTEREEAVHLDGYAKGLREALAMVREQGATVPQAPLSEALPLLVELRSFLPFGRASRLVDLVTCYVADALGVPLPEKSAAPITSTEKG